MSIDHVRKTYGVPAKIGGRIKFTDEYGTKWHCRIMSIRDGRLRVLPDDRVPNYRGRLLLHPTNNVEYF